MKKLLKRRLPFCKDRSIKLALRNLFFLWKEKKSWLKKHWEASDLWKIGRSICHKDLAPPAASTCRLYINTLVHMISHGKCNSFFCMNSIFIPAQQFQGQHSKQSPTIMWQIHKTNNLPCIGGSQMPHLQQFTWWQHMAQGEWFCLCEQNRKRRPLTTGRMLRI
jgi:hypothetical protein